MIETIYIEEAILQQPRVLDIVARFPQARKITCGRYGEVFNPKAQNFRLQKQQPALILAEKYKNFALPAPLGYGIGATRNYYFSHMLNCLYDCRYCFLQGMYQSANYVLFVNYEDFQQDIRQLCSDSPDEPLHFFFRLRLRQPGLGAGNRLCRTVFAVFLKRYPTPGWN